MKTMVISSLLLLIVLWPPMHAQETGGRLQVPILNTIGELLSTAAGRGSSATVADPCESAVAIRDGIRVHTVETPYQNGRQEIHVLLPDSYQEDKSYRVLYVLPVEKGFERKYGYGLGVFQQIG